MDEKMAALIKAVAEAMEAERKASDFYLASAGKTTSPRGKRLLMQLADFEQAHFDKLAELKAALEKDGNFIEYEGTTFQSAGEAETASMPEANLNDVLDILRLAIDAEKKAFEKYSRMAEETDDVAGREMFKRLAAEETTHRRILSDEFYQLSNAGGEWVWME
jgi:rubrerythrin